MTWEEFEKVYRKQNRGKADVSEHALQVACVRWFRSVYPDILIFAVPNGGYRTAATASSLRAEGQTAGVPDLIVPLARGNYSGLYIEMKNGKAGRLSIAQKHIHERLRNMGNFVVVCHDRREFETEVQKYLLLPENDRIMTKISVKNRQCALNL